MPRLREDRPARATERGPARQEVHLWLEAEVGRAARIQAIREDRSLTEIVNQALTEYLSRHAASQGQ